MKLFSLTLLCAACGWSASAQDSIRSVSEQPTFKNELGIFVQNNFNNSSSMDLTIAGFQYNHWKNDRLGYRIIGAYGNYSNYSGTNTYTTNGDTLIRRHSEINVRMPVLGVGVMAQRQFFRRVYLFAGLELKGAYGKGYRDTVLQKEYTGPDKVTQSLFSSSRADNNITRMIVDVNATIGGKLQFRRLVLGMELLPVQLGYQQQQSSGSTYGITDVSIGDISYRFFLNYRF